MIWFSNATTTTDPGISRGLPAPLFQGGNRMNAAIRTATATPGQAAASAGLTVISREADGPGRRHLNPPGSAAAGFQAGPQLGGGQCGVTDPSPGD
jgi:hypothetical protein